MKRIASIILPILLISPVLLAQTPAADSVKEKKLVFKLGSFYTSRLHYYGRTDSLRSSGFFPMAEIWIDKKFYITAAPVFIMNNADGFAYAGTVTTAGVQFSKEKKYMATIFLVKPIYQDNSQLVQSALKWQGAATHTFLNKVANITLGGDVKFSDNVDYGASAGLDHLFRKDMKDGSLFALRPSATLNAGTQQFTKTSYKRSGFLFFPGTEQEITTEVKKFAVLSYEFSAPLIFIKDKLTLVVSPSYVIPQNLLNVHGRPDLSERGQEMFYVVAGAKLTL